ncbi:N-formylglutamate deformylase [Alteripontixanthobacter maritimus]|uniref:N-formylglutamate deformylase n=1 Tax=Alteripontixanthobacter maritimus TaxID=2161824 RepID=A0A369Q5C6_9SPHN|nr:N-formylglutamate amidohydrolase [Alteripontixanthobacter maritimus]RDC60093.1 N-formylglutamate deformylase [Alteripontixanthobacter maritimus]
MIDGLPFRQVGVPRPGGIVCLADHASSYVPDDVPLGVPQSLVETHIGVDIGVGGVADRLARRHAIPAHIACVSRLVCDLHRREDEDAVVPINSDGHLIAGNIGADIESRLASYHRPYHDALANWLDDARPELIVALHSFTPKLETTGEPRPWEVALLYNQDDRAALHAMRMFAAEGLTVGDNEPYSGKQLNATMDRHAEAHGRPYLTIEIRQDLLATKAEQARWAALIADVANRTALAMKSS